MQPNRLTEMVQILFTSLWILQNLLVSVRCQEETGEIPKFITSSQTHRVIIGDTVVLPCQVDRLGDYVLLWKRGTSVLSAGDLKITRDPRIELVDGFNLQIKKVRPLDGGDYVCQMSTFVPDELVHTLEILVPPSVRSEPSHITISKGDTVTLQCKGSGNPVPSLTWTRRNNLLPDGEQSSDGSSYTILNADRHAAGHYLCTGNNGVGPPVATGVEVKVQYPPEVEVEQPRIHAGEGREAVLVCFIHSDPPVMKVKWYRDTMILDQDGRRLMEVRGSRHSLIIRNVQPSDYANYSCEADNKLGRNRKHIELSGRPNRPTFRSDPLGRLREAYNISWTVESFSSVEEYRLSYRRKHLNESEEHPKQWHDVVIPVGESYESRNMLARAIPSSPASVIHWKSYFIRNLEPGLHYEARVVAKNRYGWGSSSELFQFSTSSDRYPYEFSHQNDILSDSEVRDMRIASLASSTPSITLMTSGAAQFLWFILISIVLPFVHRMS